MTDREIAKLEEAIWRLTGPPRPKVDLFGDDATLPPLDARGVGSVRRKIAALLRGGYPREDVSTYWLERARIDNLAAWERRGMPARA